MSVASHYNQPLFIKTQTTAQKTTTRSKNKGQKRDRRTLRHYCIIIMKKKFNILKCLLLQQRVLHVSTFISSTSTTILPLLSFTTNQFESTSIAFSLLSTTARSPHYHQLAPFSKRRHFSDWNISSSSSSVNDNISSNKEDKMANISFFLEPNFNALLLFDIRK